MEKHEPQLAPGLLQTTEHARPAYSVVVEKSVTPEDVERPSFWAHHAYRLTPYSKIEVRSEDGTWYAEYLVTDSSRTWAKVKKLFHASLTSQDVSLSQAADIESELAKYEVIHRGPRKWSVLRLTDRAVLQENIEMKDAAVTWLKTHAAVELKRTVPA